MGGSLMSESLQVFSNCKRCNRKLKNPKTQALGYGNICYKKHKAEIENLLKFLDYERLT